MKAIHQPFRCDLCGRYSNFGVTESFAVREHPAPKPGTELLVQNTICVRCISNATALLFDGLIAVGNVEMVPPTQTEDSSSE